MYVYMYVCVSKKEKNIFIKDNIFICIFKKRR